MTSQTTNIIFLTNPCTTKQRDILNKIQQNIFTSYKVDITTDITTIDFSTGKLFVVLSFGNFSIPTKTNIIKTYTLPLVVALENLVNNKEIRKNTHDKLQEIKNEIDNLPPAEISCQITTENVIFIYKDNVYEVIQNKQLLESSLPITPETLTTIQTIREIFGDEVKDIRITRG
jgi:hypothetical protein